MCLLLLVLPATSPLFHAFIFSSFKHQKNANPEGHGIAGHGLKRLKQTHASSFRRRDMTSCFFLTIFSYFLSHWLTPLVPALSEMTSFLLKMGDIFRQDGSLMSDVRLQPPCLHPVELIACCSHAKAPCRNVQLKQNKPICNHMYCRGQVEMCEWNVETASSFSGLTAFYNPGVKQPSKPLIFRNVDSFKGVSAKAPLSRAVSSVGFLIQGKKKGRNAEQWLKEKSHSCRPLCL